MKASQTAMREIISAITDLAEIVRDLDPGRTNTYAHIETSLMKAREQLNRAEAFES